MSTRAVKQYNSAVEKAEAKYDKIRKKLDAEFEKVVGPVREKYQRIQKAAYARYDKAQAPHYKRYEDTIELPKSLLAQVKKAAEDTRLKKLRAAARVKTKARRDAMFKLHHQPKKVLSRITIGELRG